MDLEQLKYPIGRFEPIESLSADGLQKCIGRIDAIPDKVSAAVSDLTEIQLDTPYRPGGWTVRQVVHHLVDSHINSYVRYHWAMTEDEPLIKAYEEQMWAELPDGKNAPLEFSIPLLHALHKRWVYLLGKMETSDFEKLLNHPQWKKPLSLEFMTQLYAWHGDHHLAHITSLKEREGWA